jgi:hypothetical protein
MRRAVVSALISGLCLTLAACSHDQAAGPIDPPDNTTSSSVTTPTTTAPSDPAQDPPPVMPALAKQKSTAGAKAFITYFVEVLNYSYHTASTSPLRGISAPSCDVCKRLVTGVAAMKKSGGSQSGGSWTAIRIFHIASDQRDTPRYVLKVHIAKGSFVPSAHAAPSPIHRALVTDQVQLVRVTDGWLVRDVATT